MGSFDRKVQDMGGSNGTTFPAEFPAEVGDVVTIEDMETEDDGESRITFKYND